MKSQHKKHLAWTLLILLCGLFVSESFSAEERFRNVGVTRKIFGKNQVWISFGREEAKGPDYERAQNLAAGEVVSFIRHAPMKLKIDGDVHFGDVVIKAQNVSPDYPGVYSLWVKKTEAGYSLVFNAQADTWGTMHEAEFDVYEVPLTYEEIENPAKSFTVKVDALEDNPENSPNDGIVTIEWGPHRLSAKFDAQ